MTRRLLLQLPFALVPASKAFAPAPPNKFVVIHKCGSKLICYVDADGWSVVLEKGIMGGAICNNITEAQRRAKINQSWAGRCRGKTWIVPLAALEEK